MASPLRIAVVPETRRGHLGWFRMWLVGIEMTAVSEIISWGQLKATANIHSKHIEVLGKGL